MAGRITPGPNKAGLNDNFAGSFVTASDGKPALAVVNTDGTAISGGGGGGGNVTITSPIGQTTMSGSVSVAVASNQSAVPATVQSADLDLDTSTISKEARGLVLASFDTTTVAADASAYGDDQQANLPGVHPRYWDPGTSRFVKGRGDATNGQWVNVKTSAVAKAEDAAASSGDTGAFVLGVRNDSLSATSSADGDYTQVTVDQTGRAVVIPFAPSTARISGTATSTGTADTSVVAASGSASLKTYITDIQVVNTGASTSLITFKDGNAGSTLMYTIAPTGGGSNIHLSSPIATSANTAFYFAAATASTTIYVSAQGFKAP